MAEQAFNYDRDLIRGNFASLTGLTDTSSQVKLLPSATAGLQTLNDLYASRSLWQLFTIFALIFLVLEMLIQKFFKN